MENNSMKKILILKSDRGDFEKYYIEHMQAENIKTVSIHRYNDGIMWKLTWLWREIFKLPCSHIWFGNWKRELSDYDEIIVFDNNLNWNILKYINKKNPKARIIAWYWNFIKKKKQLVPKKYRRICEIWSFDKGDCIKYGIKQNTQFYVGEMREQEDLSTYSAIFVGKDKGRYEKIMEIKNFLVKNGFSVYVNVVRDKSSLISRIKEKVSVIFCQSYCKKDYGKPLSYYQLIKKIEKSKCIIDIPQKGQTGMTARVLEALFFHKKLITSDKTLLNFEWFREENILIWDGRPSEDKVNSFFEVPYIKIGEIEKKYSFEQWIRNFNED